MPWIMPKIDGYHTAREGFKLWLCRCSLLGAVQAHIARAALQTTRNPLGQSPNTVVDLGLQQGAAARQCRPGIGRA